MMNMWPLRRHRPELSVVIVVHNMAREAPRTLYSLSAAYQRHIAAEDYEVIVVDNGSTPPLDAKVIDGLAGNFRLLRLDPASQSPARAINRGLAEARGKVVGVMVDGARIVTPGFLHFARHGLRLYPRAVVVTLGWYLGRDLQRWAMEADYNQKREEELLASIGWPQDGYRLFEVGAFDESSLDGWFAQIEESNGLFLSRESWDQLCGVDERFDAPGGGYLNLDTFARAIELPDSELVVLLGEATFHQLHGGIATNQNYRSLASTLAIWEAQYEAIRKRPWRAPSPRNRTYVGSLPPAVLPHFARSIIEPARGLPLGPSFDRTLWSSSPSQRPADPVCAALVDLAESEFRLRRFEASAAVARIARSRAPDEPAPQRLLATAGAWLRDAGEPPDDRRAGFHLARAKACRLLGDTKAAEAEFRVALAWDADLPEARSGLAELRLRREDATERGLPMRLKVDEGLQLPSEPSSMASLPSRQAIVVLGMHRSGTSAVGGVLSGLGAAAPKKTLMGPDPCNLKGFFESFDLAEAHNALLASAGSCWHDWRKFDLQWARSEAAAPHSAKIKAILLDEFDDEPMILLKDPRICRFLPYTLAILADLNMSPLAVLPIRNPLEVAFSLKRRNNLAVPKSILLWLRHVLDAEYYSRNVPRYFLSYEGLLQDWRHHIDRLAEQTGLVWPDRSDRTEAEIDQFLTGELYRERATWDQAKEHPEIPELARYTYRILTEICTQGENKELLDRLDAVRAKFNEDCQIFGAAVVVEEIDQGP